MLPLPSALLRAVCSSSPLPRRRCWLSCFDQETASVLKQLGLSVCCTAATIMGFGDLSSAAGLRLLNDFLADKSYIEGYVPSQADIAVFEAVSTPPPAELFHALRWYNHVKSYEKQKARSVV